MLFSLSGGIPATSKFEARRTALEKKYEKYNALKQTAGLLRYQELAAQVATPRSQSGLQKKEWTEMKQEFVRLRKSAEVVEFFKLQKTSHNFHAITDWEPVFTDEFDGGALDKSRWITHPLVDDEKLLYSPANEGHLYTDGSNVSVDGSSLKITTKAEHASGLGFSPALGFINVERECTAGLVSTAKSHRQLYGKVEAKIRFSQSGKGVYHTMWLGAQRRLPHLNVIRIGAKLEFGVFAAGNDKKQHTEAWNRSMLRQNTYYIVTLEWSESCITWKINGATMFTAPNVLHEPMYVGFASGVEGSLSGSAQPIFEVDWVKTYKRHS